MIPAALLCRVSTEDQRETGSIETQVAFADRWAPDHGYQIVDRYLDAGWSGTIPLDQRPEGARLLRDARLGLFSTVLVYQVDRLGRDPQVVLSALTELQACGVRIQSMNEQFDERDPMGRFLLTLLSSIGRLVRDQTIVRSIEGSNRLARAGAWLGGPPPYGYRVEGRGKEARLIIHEPEAEIVRLVYRLYLQPGQNAMTIAHELNRRGIPMRNGSLMWNHGQVIRMLAATEYYGVHRYGKRTRRDREVIEHPCPAIIEEATWHACRALASERRRMAARNTRRDYLLAGLLRCGIADCGRLLRAYTVTPHGKEYAYYRCGSIINPTRYVRGEPHCGLPQLPSVRTEAEAWWHVAEIVNDPDGLERLFDTVPAPSPNEEARAELVEVQRQLEERRKGRARLLSLIADGLADEGEARVTLANSRSADAALVAREAALRSQCNERTITASAKEEARETVERLRTELASGITYDAQRRALLALVREFEAQRREGKVVALIPRWRFIS
jgi:site-specific DNA recombinase